MKFFRIVTPTCLDVREIVTLGLTTKTDGGKIGHKGTGLKFSLAFIHRLGGFLMARGPGYFLRSETIPLKIRDHEHQLIRLRSVSDPNNVWETHMTLHAGADTWNEPWYILRELIQNALDEGGSYEVTDEEAAPQSTGTVVQVPMLPELEKAWNERDVWMQPRWPGLVGHGHPTIKGLYFHGFLAYRATEPWSYSFDVTEILKRQELSEDRVIKEVDLANIFLRIAEKLEFEFEASAIYRKGLELQPTEDIAKIFEAVYTHINHSQTAWGGSRGFNLARLVEVYTERFGSRAAFTTSPISDADPNIYYARAAGYEPVTVNYKLSSILSGYTELRTVRACLPSLTQRLKKMKKVELTRYEKLKAALRLLRRIRPADIKVEIVTKVMDQDHIQCSALADPANRRILVMDSLLDEDIPQIAKVLIEEFVHLTSGGGDMSLEMQRGLVSVIYDLLTRHRRVNVENIQT